MIDNKSIFNFLFSFRRDAEVTPTYIDCQFNDVYACFIDKFDIENIKFDPAEVSGIISVPFVEFERMIAEKDKLLVPAYSDECKDVVYFLKKQLSR